METITVRLTRQQVDARLRKAVAAVLGHVPDSRGVGEALLTRVGVRLLSLIQQAFIVKARGGTDSAGIKWAPLSPATIAQRRVSSAEKKRLGITGKRVRGLLTPAQDRRWRQIYGSRLATLRAMGINHGEASARAAQIAWAVLKESGAKTKIGLLGSREVEILRDTSELFRSFEPGTERTRVRADGQIFEVSPGSVVVGTRKKPWHHAGVAGRLPARPYWPTDGTLPDDWNEALLDTIARGLVRAIGLYLQRAA